MLTKKSITSTPYVFEKQKQKRKNKGSLAPLKPLSLRRVYERTLGSLKKTKTKTKKGSAPKP